MDRIIIFEGLDRCLKDTMIDKVKNHISNADILHYSKPPNNVDKRKYQNEAFTRLFKVVSFYDNFMKGSSLLFNRSHIGEAVYSNLYRGYDGSYVFDLEREHIHLMDKLHLITLIDTDVERYKMRSDGNSFSNNFENENDLIIDECYRFYDATIQSNIKNKIVLNLAYFYNQDARINTGKLLSTIKTFLQV